MKASDRGRNVKSKEFFWLFLMNFVLVSLIQTNETFLCSNDCFCTRCGVAFRMEWMCVATYLLNAESINACRCGVANKSRMIWRCLVLIGWATVWRQQQGSDQASRYSSVSLLAGRRWRMVRERALVNNSASGVCILLCVVATCVVSRCVWPVWSVELYDLCGQ